ncbi:unnamed protein product [Toxocara canis]|uniref:Secreted protein n=1 Tax=Toxocara canis TaxID=6265 RepID=A0A183U0S6_TOXCA|nr:unnamed protein product [Toxocara canis]
MRERCFCAYWYLWETEASPRLGCTRHNSIHRGPAVARDDAATATGWLGYSLVVLIPVERAASVGASNAYHLRLPQLQVSIALGGPGGQSPFLPYSQATAGVAPTLLARHWPNRRDSSESG